MNLLWLGDPKSFDTALVGGKAATSAALPECITVCPMVSPYL